MRILSVIPNLPSTSSVFLHSRPCSLRPGLNFAASPRRSKWIWAPSNRDVSSKPSLPPLPGFTLEHPDNLPPDQRYQCRIRPFGSRLHTKTRYGFVTLSRNRHQQHAVYTWPISPNEAVTVHPDEKCQLVWDAKTRSVSLHTEDQHPVPGSTRYLNDMLLTSSITGPFLINELLRSGHISQAGELRE